MNLSKNVKVVLAKAAAASGTTAVTTDVIDTQGFEGVMFFGSIATKDTGNFANAQQGKASDMSDAADLADTKVTPATNGHSFLIDVCHPQERYVQVVITRGQATSTGDVYAVLYGPREAPTAHGSTILAETHVSPAEGTA